MHYGIPDVYVVKTGRVSTHLGTGSVIRVGTVHSEKTNVPSCVLLISASKLIK